MRIVLDARTAGDHFPGIGRYVASLAGALAELLPPDHGQAGLQLLYDPAASAARVALPAGVPAIPCPASPFGLGQQWAVPSALRRARADVYHSPYYLMPYLAGRHTVLTCYDLIPLRYPGYFSGSQRLIYRLAHRLALAASAAVLAISEATRADLVRLMGVDPQRITVTPLAAGPEFAPQSPGRVAEVAARYGLPASYVLYLASNKPHKNLAGLIECWPQVLAGAPNARLVVAGHWDARYPEARQRAAALGLAGSVHFAGPVADADLPALYSGARVFVFPSFYEGFGLPVLEAMACGAPVVCADTSSLPEVAGEAALMVDPADRGALAAAIGGVLADDALAARLSAASQAQAARFSWRATAAATLAVYEQVGS